MNIQDVIKDGNTKKVYATDEDKVVIEFMDDLPFASGKKRISQKGKGEINAQVAAYLFEYLNSYNVPTQYLRKYDEKSIVAKKLKMIPLRMVIWNVATKTLAKRLGLKDGTILETPVLEMYLKNTKLKNPLINDYHAYALGLCDRNEMNMITRIGTKINAVLKSFLGRKNLMLANFTLEFGKTATQVLLGDEISIDNMELWDVTNKEKPDASKFQLTAENAATVYPALKERIVG